MKNVLGYPNKSYRTLSVRERFEQYIFYSPDDCWYWTGSCTKGGYGTFSIQPPRKTLSSHRASYELYKGEIQDGLLVCHKCDNPKCVNPDHLFLGTRKDNAQDCAKKKRSLQGTRNHFSVLTEEQVREIRLSSKEKPMPLKMLSEKYNVIRATIWHILKGKTWKHLI